MKWLGLIKDPKDLTTKEYVDDADKIIKEDTEKSISELKESTLNKDDITEYTSEEVKTLWNKVFTKSN